VVLDQFAHVIAMVEYDLLIRNGLIVDGTGKAPFKGSVAIKADQIAGVGELREAGAGRVIDAKGSVISPGFIDAHGHADHTILLYPLAESYLEQGVTTCMCGNCGFTPAPLKDHWLSLFWDMDAFYELRPFKYYSPEIVPLEEFRQKAKELYGLDIDWKSFPEFVTRLQKVHFSLNLATFVGHNTIRVAVMGVDQKRRPTENEMEEMKGLVENAMEAGAWGLSTGLDYPPGVFSETEEIVELAKVAAKHGGIYSTHWRRTGLRREQTIPQEKIQGLIEAVGIGKRVGIPVQISHLLSGYTITPPPPPILEEASAKATLDVIDKGVKDGVDVWFDVIPNTTGGVFTSSFLLALLSPWVREVGSPQGLAKALALSDFRSELKEILNAGKWYALNPKTDRHWATRIQITDSKDKEAIGKTIAELAQEKGKDALDTLFDLLQRDPDTRALPAAIQSETEKATYLRHPRAMVGIDTFAFDYRWETKHIPKIYPHPNTYGGFTRYFRVYQRELRNLSLEEAVRKVTGSPAQRFGLRDRGMIANGMKADILVFDPDEIGDVGDHAEPRKRPRGIRLVLVNGEVAVENGAHTGRTPGVLIRKPTDQR